MQKESLRTRGFGGRYSRYFAGGFVLRRCRNSTRRYSAAPKREFRSQFPFSHSIVRNYLQFVPVCSSLSHLHPVSKIAANPWGQIWVTGFGAGQGAFVGHSGSRKLASGLSRCFDCMAREKQQAGPVPAARFPQAGIARPLPPEPTGRLRFWRRTRWPTESPRQHPGARAGPLRGRRTSRSIPFAWQWPAARPAPACRRKASGRRSSQPQGQPRLWRRSATGR